MVEGKVRLKKITSRRTTLIRISRLTTLDTFFKHILKIFISALWFSSLNQFLLQSCPLIFQSSSVLVAELSSDYPVFISSCCRVVLWSSSLYQFLLQGCPLMIQPLSAIAAGGRESPDAMSLRHADTSLPYLLGDRASTIQNSFLKSWFYV